MLAEAAKQVNSELKAAVMSLAAKQVSMAASAIQKNMTASAKTAAR
jgi:hypothetical protein